MDIYRIKGASGPVANQSHTLASCTLIGRADDCDIRVEVEGMASHHAEIRVGEDQVVTLKLLATESEVRVNGEPARELALASGDEIRIANCRWVLQAPGLRPVKKLTTDAVRKKVPLWPWLTLAAVAAIALAWHLGYLRL